jgi:flagellar motility protein MotE (MotC chaperone)
MRTGPIRGWVDRFGLDRLGRVSSMGPRTNRHSQLWTMVGGIVGSTILFWVMVQLGQASPEPKSKTQPVTTSGLTQGGVPQAQEAENSGAGSDDDAKLLAPPAAQGPAIDVPREVLDMLAQRKRDLDRREHALRQNEERLMIVRGQIEELLDQNEALEKKIQSAQAKEDRAPSLQVKAHAEKERSAQEQRTQLAKIYESMPSEDAASRLEHMPDRKAIEILKMVKAKTAGAILAQVKADRAAKLTEQLLTHTP